MWLTFSYDDVYTRIHGLMGAHTVKLRLYLPAVCGRMMSIAVTSRGPGPAILGASHDYVNWKRHEKLALDHVRAPIAVQVLGMHEDLSLYAKK